MWQHGEKYYTSRPNPTLRAFHEMIANFTELKVTGNIEYLDEIKDCFGEEFYNMLENVYNSFFD